MRARVLIAVFFLLGLSACRFFSGKAPADIYLSDDLDSLERPSLPMPSSQQVMLSLVQDTTMKSGFVRVRLVIDEYGKVTETKITNSLGAREDSVAASRVRGLPDFIPGRIKGRPVKTVYFLAFIFNPDASSRLTGKR